VGIFKSHRLTIALRMAENFNVFDRGDLLKRILRGEVPSSTREPGRGNGIPGMYDHCKNERIKNLVILANDAFGNAETESYQVLSKSFAGTLLYWEICQC